MAETITNAEILALMDNGTIVVEGGLTEPALIMRNRLVKPYYAEQGGRRRLYGSNRWRYTLRYKGKRRTILRSNLVWLWFIGQIPEGYVVHHGEQGKDCDAIGNLYCVRESEHLDFHYGKTERF